jgi:hypothetical protein
MLHIRLSVLPVFLAMLFHVPIAEALDKKVVGRIEFVKLERTDFKIKAKIDTGATLTSINAEILNEFTQSGEKWIRFRIDNNTGEEIILERKVERYVNIKRKLSSSLNLPVINIGICLGNVYRVIEADLVRRTEYLYPVLIGRNYLRGLFFVDPDVKFSTAPDCKKNR